MADLFSVTAPLRVRLPDGYSKVVAELCRHPQGVVIFDLFWPDDPLNAIHLIKGQLAGEGPWKIAGHIFYVLGCHGTDAELATDFNQWRLWRQQHPERYPDREQIQQLARSAADKKLLVRQLEWL